MTQGHRPDLGLTPVNRLGHSHWVADPVEQARLGRRAQLLAGASVAYNVVEAGVAIAAGIAAGSVALIGFGLDSTIEVSKRAHHPLAVPAPVPESRERRPSGLFAVSFFALAAYVTVEAVSALVGGEQPEVSLVGIGLAVASILVMPWLSRAQRRTGRRSVRRAVEAEAASRPGMRLSLRRVARRAAAQRIARLGLGRPGGRAGDRRRRGP